MKKIFFIALIAFACILPSCVQKHCPEVVVVPSPGQDALDSLKLKVTFIINEEQNAVIKLNELLGSKLEKKGVPSFEEIKEMHRLETEIEARKAFIGKLEKIIL